MDHFLTTTTTKKVFFLTNFCVTFAKNIIVHSDPDSINKFKFRSSMNQSISSDKAE